MFEILKKNLQSKKPVAWPDKVREMPAAKNPRNVTLELRNAMSDCSALR
jgi:hypothetical protein